MGKQFLLPKGEIMIENLTKFAEKFTEWQPFINVGLGIIIFALLLIFKTPIAKGILSFTAKILFLKKPELKDGFKQSLLRPVAIFIAVLGLFIGLYIKIKKPIILNSFKIFTILIICWCIISYVSENLNAFFSAREADPRVNSVAVRFISNILKVLTISIAIVMIVSEMGYNINGLITGLGVGGLAISLAAQDSLKNLIAGFFIILDKPFDVGDLIETDEVQGIVEDITMRSTRLRQLNGSPIVVPNSKLSEANIANLSRFVERVVNFKIGLLYSTDEKTITECEDEIREYLSSLPTISDRNLRVCFNEFGESSLNIEIRCHTSTIDYEDYNKLVEQINLEIMRIIGKHNTDFAYPTTSVIINK